MKIRYSYNSGAGRLGCFFIILTIGLLWAGGQQLYTALTNRTPTVLSYEEYIQTKPKAGWLTLTNCIISLAGSSYKTTIGSETPTELFIPVRSKFSSSKTIHVLLATRNEQLISTFMEMQKFHSSTEAFAWALTNRDRVFPKRDVTGVVRFGIEMDDKERRKLAKLQESIADDFIIIDDGREPSLLKGLGLFAGGLALLAFCVVVQRRGATTPPTAPVA